MEHLYEKWIVVPRMLTEHLQARAADDDELAQKDLIKISEFENDQGDHRPATMGDTTLSGTIYQKLLCVFHRPNHRHDPILLVSCYGALLCETRTRFPNCLA
jgi:hypothetical protein